MITGQNIIDQARTWVGTKFHHQGRSKITKEQPGAVDCIGLIVGVAQELNIADSCDRNSCIVRNDRTDYSRVPSGEFLYEELKKHFDELAIDKIKIGDIVLMKLRGNPQHLALVSSVSPLQVIHCLVGPDKVTEHGLNDRWKEMIVTVFRFKKESLRGVHSS